MAGAPHVLAKNKGRRQEVTPGLSHSPSYPALLSARCFRPLLSPVIWEGETCDVGDVAGERLVSRSGDQPLLVLRSVINSEPGLPVSQSGPSQDRKELRFPVLTRHGPSCCARAELSTSTSRSGQDGRYEAGTCVPEIGLSLLGVTGSPVPCCQHLPHMLARIQKSLSVTPPLLGSVLLKALSAVKRNPLELAQKQAESPPADRPFSLPLGVMWSLPLAHLCGLHRVLCGLASRAPPGSCSCRTSSVLSTRCQLWLV